MDVDVVNDLKQFIAATASQEAETTRTELRGEIKRLEQKIDDLTDFVSQAIDTSNDAADCQLKDHERRVTRLEQKAA